MNSILKLIPGFLLAAAVSSANTMTFPKITKVGIMQHKVIYASPKYKVKKSGVQNKAYVKMIAQWGVHVFEVGSSEFNCSTSGTCKFNQWISLSFYELCQVKNQQARCSGKIGGGDNSSVANYSTKGYFELHEKEFQNESDSRGDYDFPERGNDYWEYPSNLF